MGRPLRKFCPDTLYLVRNATHRGEHRFRPTPEMRDLINGLLAKHAQHHQIGVVAYIFMSDEFLMAATSTEMTLHAFMRDFKRDLTVALQREQQLPGSVWAARYQATPVLEDMHAEVLAEIIGRPCADGLVAHPQDWSGASSWPAHQNAAEVVGWWTCGEDFTRLKRRKANRDVPEKKLRQMAATEYRLTLEKLPIWADLDDAAYLQKLDDIAREAADKRLENWEAWHPADDETGEIPPPPGIEAVLKWPLAEPAKNFALAKQEVCLTKSSARFEAWKKKRRGWEKAYRKASKRLRKRARKVYFPAGMIPPGYLYCVGSPGAIRRQENLQDPAELQAQTG